jgi:hypothetical protein
MESLQSQSELWRAAREKWVTILCVVVSPCELPMMAKYVRLCTLTGMAQDAARQCFRQFISDTETAEFQPFQIASQRDGLPVEALMRRHQELEPEINKDTPVTSTGLTATLVAARRARRSAEFAEREARDAYYRASIEVPRASEIEVPSDRRIRGPLARSNRFTISCSMFAIAAIAIALTFELPPVRSRATWGPLPFPFAAACLQPLLLAAMVLRSSVDPGPTSG